MSTLKTGDRVPEFSLKDQTGADFVLGDALGKKVLIIYFYPKDETPGCTAEACAFRDEYEEFVQAGAEVIGVSADSVDSHHRFAVNRRLPFPLLSDPNNTARQRFGVTPTLFGLIPGRVTFVVDKTGIIRHVFDSQLRATKHVSEALRIVKSLV